MTPLLLIVLDDENICSEVYSYYISDMYVSPIFYDLPAAHRPG
jgi:hypothetical protein